MLLAQSFPTTNSALASACGDAAVSPLCSFNISRPQAGLPSRQLSAMAHQAGNTMCTNVVGSVLCWLFLYLKKAHVQNVSVPSSLRVCSFDNSDMSRLGSLRSAAKQCIDSPASSASRVSGTASLSLPMCRSNSSQSIGTESHDVNSCPPSIYNAFKAARMKALGLAEEL